MFEKIVVAHDHRAGGDDALALARLLASTTGAKLILAGVIPLGLTPADAEVIWEAAEHEFADMIRQRATEADGEARVFHSHSVARGLSDLAEEVDADLIVVGSTRRGKVGRILAGNIALQVLHGAHCPVAVAPVDYAASHPDRLASLVVGVDGAAEAQAATKAAARLAAAAVADSTLVAVLEPPPVGYGKGGGEGTHDLAAAIREHLQEELERAAGAFADATKPELRVLEGSPAEQLQEACQDASLLVVGSRGHGPVGRVLLGSTDAKLLDSAPVPLLVWPRGARAPAS